jgi:hypothetical protein
MLSRFRHPASVLVPIVALAFTAMTNSVQDDRFQQAVANLGERCFPGDAFDTSAPIPANGVKASPATSDKHQDSAALDSARRLSAAADRAAGNPKQIESAQAPNLTRISDFAELSSLADVERVLYRRVQSELILIGPAANNEDGLRPDDWQAAFRAVAKFGMAGVSIDPGDNKTSMKVRYIGGIERSHLGATFFEADRTLKLMSTGFDNLDCSKWPLQPKDLLTELDLIDGEMRSQTFDRGWHRFWFEPSDAAIKEDPATPGVARFEVNRLVVLDESIPPGRPSASAQAFSSSISKRFLGLTAQIPAFRDLQRQAVLVALAKWMADRDIPADRTWIPDSINTVDTPETTPSVTVMRATLLDEGYLRYGIHGGVDFQKPNKYAHEAGVRRPFTGALQNRPLKSNAWNFSYGGAQYRAVAVRIKNPVAIGRQAVTWQRTSVMLPQPGTDKLIFPTDYVRGLGRLIIKNEDASSMVTVRVNGLTAGTFVVSPGSQTSIGVRPGSYQLSATATCGTRNDTVVISEGSVDEHQYSCRIVR